jgi:hypothetical protein
MSDIDRRVASRKFGDVNNNFRRGELKRLFLHRGVPEVAVYNMVEDILAERCRWTKQPLGRRVNLTFAEKDRLGIRTIARVCPSRTRKILAGLGPACMSVQSRSRAGGAGRLGRDHGMRRL